MAVERKIVLTDNVDIFFEELLRILFEKEYFGFLDAAKAYHDRLAFYINKYIGILQGKDAPPYFNRYGSNLKYITYRANKATLWYIFYQQWDNVYLIRHITNNHVAAQYFE
ncbi:MAG: hypothetical protein LBU22_14035 [Dysgonamonadaceae bacterium]|jgi:hypothetical protein|nr:hypothetical protein [Dysgonamonadaceae bacterium]